MVWQCGCRRWRELARCRLRQRLCIVVSHWNPHSYQPHLAVCGGDGIEVSQGPGTWTCTSAGASKAGHVPYGLLGLSPTPPVVWLVSCIENAVQVLAAGLCSSLVCVGLRGEKVRSLSTLLPACYDVAVSSPPLPEVPPACGSRCCRFPQRSTLRELVTPLGVAFVVVPASLCPLVGCLAVLRRGRHVTHWWTSSSTQAVGHLACQSCNCSKLIQRVATTRYADNHTIVTVAR